ncbi:transmembrane protein 154 isoform X1 [Chelmon rostratus]|uniref:transmembrane protein 154 isoform X1 n=1 Tax=Chelmon rostratus TaxID=109905 RepID=UPI001BECEDFF|nr:transmembrane protein 154 isoform X1 [Chelmon rostratus]
MSASWPGSMRGPPVKTPLFLLLLLLLLSTLTRTVLCQYDDGGADPDAGPDEEETGDTDPGDGDTHPSEPPLADPDATSAPDPPPTDEGASVESGVEGEHGSGQPGHYPIEADETTEDPNLTDPTSIPVEDEGLSPIIILIPVVLVVVIIGMIVCGIFINRRWNNKARDQELRKEDPYLDGSSTEKVPMPMFEEDVPSVLELEMEELDQWMKKDGETAEDSKHT